jgi:hypothetical protein
MTTMRSPPCDRLPVLTVTFVAGYGDDSDVPAPIKAAILLMVERHVPKSRLVERGGFL